MGRWNRFLNNKMQVLPPPTANVPEWPQMQTGHPSVPSIILQPGWLQSKLGHCTITPCLKQFLLEIRSGQWPPAINKLGAWVSSCSEQLRQVNMSELHAIKAWILNKKSFFVSLTDKLASNDTRLALNLCQNFPSTLFSVKIRICRKVTCVWHLRQPSLAAEKQSCRWTCSLLHWSQRWC